MSCQDAYQRIKNRYEKLEAENKALKESRDELLEALEEVDLIPIHELDFNKISDIVQEAKALKEKEA